MARKHVKSVEEFNAKIEEELKAAFDRNSDYKFRMDAKEYYLDKFNRIYLTDFLKRWLVTYQRGKVTMEQIEKDFEHFVQRSEMAADQGEGCPGK